MTPEAKLRLEALKGSRASDVLSEYLEYRLSQRKEQLISVNAEQVQRMQGRAAELQELIKELRSKQ